MKVLVTGGAGYIGSHTVKALLQHGYEVVVLDSLELGSRRLVPSNVKLIVGNIGDVTTLDNLFEREKPEAVFHFAAYKAPGESVEQPDKYFRNNVAGTETLLSAMVRHKVNYFIFSSSCSVFGTPKNMPVAENNNPFNPESPYAQTKLMVEQMLKWFDMGYGLKSVILRYFNAAGADPSGEIGENWDLTLNLIPLVLKAAAGRAPTVSIFGTDYPTPDGTAIRDYIHVSDLAEAHVLALEYLLKNNTSTAYNLGTGKGSSVREVVDTARRVTGIDFKAEEKPRRPGDPIAIWADNSKAKRELGWDTHYNLEEILKTAWNWHKNHLDGI